MQNRGMFPYRRQGPKKRKGNAARRGRGPQRPLPNSARELIPVLQSATKALAQVLAGRSGDSGQLAYAQTVHAHAERLLADRQANRLNPADREEFLEQLARLKLTVADAESEAEGETEDEDEEREAAPAVDRARLREMALALGMPRPAEPTPVPEAEEPAVAERAEAPEPIPSEEASPAARSEHNQRSGRLQLSVSANEEASAAVSIRGPVRRRTTGQRAPARLKPVRADDESEGEAAAPANGGVAHARPDEVVREETAVGNGHNTAAEVGAGDEGGARRRPAARRPAKGIPDGWVIDEEGFVVPGTN